jgi:DNA polymerase-1
VGGDYSQIELRVMAHLSGDANLVEAFERREDVHASTARRIFGVGEGPLDPALRRRFTMVVEFDYPSAEAEIAVLGSLKGAAKTLEADPVAEPIEEVTP